MATIGFHISEMTSYDEVHLDYVIVGFFKFYPGQALDETGKLVDVTLADIVELYRSNVREQVPEWKSHPDIANNYRMKFTAKDFGQITKFDKASVEAFCVGELDKLDGMRVVEDDADEVIFATGDKTKLDTYSIRESQRKVG